MRVVSRIQPAVFFTLLGALGCETPIHVEGSTTGAGGSGSSTAMTTTASTSTSTGTSDACAALACGAHASCVVMGSSAKCTCDAGFQDNGAKGTCTPACAASSCSGHGTCEDGSGTIQCTCTAGYTGAACAACASGYIEYPAGSATCIPDPCIGKSCGPNGTCDNNTGVAVCDCSPGFVGATCDTCTRFADASATGTGAATTWANAAPRVQDAIASALTAAASAGSCEVWVAKGTYYVYSSSASDTITATGKVPLYGGFASGAKTHAESDPAANPTVLSGRQNGTGATQVKRVVTLSGSTAITVDGFTIRDGGNAGSEGGGVLANGVHATLARCEITANVNDTGYGGGVAINNSPGVTVDHCSIHDNTGAAGAGVYGGSSTVSVTHSTFAHNTSKGPGGGIYAYGTTLAVDSTSFTKNQAVDGGGIAFRAPTTVAPSLSDVLFEGNHVNGSGGGFYSDQINAAEFDNVWVVGNAAGAGGGFALYNANGVVTCRGCTLSGNWTPGGGTGVNWASSATPPLFEDSIVWGNPDLVSATGNDVNQSVSSDHSDVRASGAAGNFNPNFVSAPSFFDWTTGSGSTTTIIVNTAASYSVGDVIEIDGDATARTVIAASGTTVTFSPARATASVAATQVRDWGAVLGMFDYHVRPTSMAAHAGVASEAPALDLDGFARGATPDLGCYQSH